MPQAGRIFRGLFIAAFALLFLRSIQISRADALFRSGELSKIEQAVHMEPGNEAWLATLAIGRFEHGGESPGSLQHNLQQLNRALQLNPADSAVLMTLGMNAEQRGDMRAAEDYLVRARQFDRRFKPAWTLANFYFRANQAAKFWPEIRACLALIEPRNLEPWSFDPAPIYDLCWRQTQDSRRILDILPKRRATLVPYLDYLVAHGLADAAVEAWPEIIRVAQPEDLDVVAGFCDDIIRVHPRPASVAVWNMLVERGFFRSNRLFPQQGISIENPQFLPPFVNRAFGWHFNDNPGIYITHDTSGLELEFGGEEPERAELLWKFVPVLPGTNYRLHWEVDRSQINDRFGAPGAVDPGFSFEVTGDQTPFLPSCPPLFSKNARTNGSCDFKTAGGDRQLRLSLRYDRRLGTTRVRGTLALRGVTLEKR